MLRKFLGNFTLNLSKFYRSVEFQNKFQERLKVNMRDIQQVMPARYELNKKCFKF